MGSQREVQTNNIERLLEKSIALGLVLRDVIHVIHIDQFCFIFIRVSFTGYQAPISSAKLDSLISNLILNKYTYFSAKIPPNNYSNFVSKRLIRSETKLVCNKIGILIKTFLKLIRVTLEEYRVKHFYSLGSLSTHGNYKDLRDQTNIRDMFPIV